MKNSILFNKFLFLLLLLITITQMQICNAKLDIPKNQLIVKSNTLNLLFGLPSLTVEYQIAKSQSISASIYKGKLIALSANYWSGAHIDYRNYFSQYLNRQRQLKGLYVQLGYNFHSENNGGTPNYNYHGLRTDLGFQYLSPKSRFVFDTGVGLFTYFDSKRLQTNFRLNASIGLRLF